MITFMSVIIIVILKIKDQGVKTEDTIIIIALIALFIPLLQIISSQRDDTNERILNLLILSTYISLFNKGKIDEHDKKVFIQIINYNKKK